MAHPGVRVSALLLAAWLGMTPRLAAQAIGAQPGPTITAATMGVRTTPTAPVEALSAFNAGLRVATQPTHWLTGGIIGGATLGVLTGVFAAGMCANSDSRNSTGRCVASGLFGAVVGGLLGFTVGALIGGQIPKGDAPVTAAPPAAS